jgi:hypothetical protein
MAEHASPPHAHGHDDHAEQSWVIKYLWSTDHKIICFQYMFTGMSLGVVAAFFSYVFRMQMAFPGMNVPGWGLVTPAQYNMLITNHGAIMIFWVAMPVLIEVNASGEATKFGVAPEQVEPLLEKCRALPGLHAEHTALIAQIDHALANVQSQPSADG